MFVVTGDSATGVEGHVPALSLLPQSVRLAPAANPTPSLVGVKFRGVTAVVVAFPLLFSTIPTANPGKEFAAPRSGEAAAMVVTGSVTSPAVVGLPLYDESKLLVMEKV